MNRSAKILYWKYRYEKEVSDLDLDMLNEVFPEMINETEHWSHDTILMDDERFPWSDQAHPIKIDTAISLLNELKEYGCNYVELFYHSDHVAYHFIGIDAQRANQFNIDEYEKKLNKKISEERSARIAELEVELKKLKEEETENGIVM